MKYAKKHQDLKMVPEIYQETAGPEAYALEFYQETPGPEDLSAKTYKDKDVPKECFPQTPGNRWTPRPRI